MKTLAKYLKEEEDFLKAYYAKTPPASVVKVLEHLEDFRTFLGDRVGLSTEIDEDVEGTLESAMQAFGTAMHAIEDTRAARLN